MKTYKYDINTRSNFNEDIKAIIRSIELLNDDLVVDLYFNNDNPIFKIFSYQFKELYIFDNQIKIEFKDSKPMYITFDFCKNIEIDLIDSDTGEIVAEFIYKA